MVSQTIVITAEWVLKVSHQETGMVTKEYKEKEAVSCNYLGKW